MSQTKIDRQMIDDLFVLRPIVHHVCQSSVPNHGMSAMSGTDLPMVCEYCQRSGMVRSPCALGMMTCPLSMRALLKSASANTHAGNANPHLREDSVVALHKHRHGSDDRFGHVYRRQNPEPPALERCILDAIGKPLRRSGQWRQLPGVAGTAKRGDALPFALACSLIA